MSPSWTTASSTMSPSTGAVAWSAGMCAVLPATLPATSSRLVADRSMLTTGRRGGVRSTAEAGADEEDEEHGDDQRGDEADDQRDRPQVVVRDGERDAHLPTATFRSARAACRAVTPEALVGPLPS